MIIGGGVESGGLVAPPERQLASIKNHTRRSSNPLGQQTLGDVGVWHASDGSRDPEAPRSQASGARGGGARRGEGPSSCA